ncbi:hypothetical protein K461DRAFT_269998 [Myriangium duriaei CBS 260.36]|uniref:Mid2 domain-containing protein n=1 Tax=Myriangium duriaei CBS 260.36 TaxID=1168546 RepID=A0A9P4MK93_9PEZI|nr:hypothetical protein K461DRAFT_269998 [Myriangium duriaei CBS 260.36]
MLRNIHLAVLFLAFVAYTSAWTFPDGFLKMPRQVAGLSTGASSALSPANGAGSTGTGSTDTTTAAATTTTSTGGSGGTTTSPTTTSIPTTTPTTTIPTTTSVPPSTTTTTDTPPTTTTQSSAGPSTTTTSVTSAATTSEPASQSSEGTSSKTDAGSTTHAAATTSSINPTQVHETMTTIIVTSGGKTSSAVVKATVTGSQTPTWTSEPGLANGDSGGSSTLSDVGKKVIAGIVGGVGGALLLAGIAFAVYRIWFRKNHESLSQDDDFFGSSDSVAAQKQQRSPSSGWGPTNLTSKFSEPLDRYKSPTSPSTVSQGYKSPGSLNAASNF